MKRYTVKFTPAHRTADGRKKWTYKRGDLLCGITHIGHGDYEIFAYRRKGNRYELYGIEYAPNERDAKAIARDFLTS